MQVPCKTVIGKSVHIAKQLDITATRNVRDARVSAIGSCAQKKNTRSFEKHKILQTDFRIENPCDRRFQN
jgi:hypothetical protein